MDINWNAIKTALDFVALLLAVGAYIYAAVINRTKANNAAIDEVKTVQGKRLGRHADRLTKLETTTETLPKHEDLERIHSRISAVGEKVSGLSSGVSEIKGCVDGIKTTVGLLNQYHMAEKK